MHHNAIALWTRVAKSWRYGRCIISFASVIRFWRAYGGVRVQEEQKQDRIGAPNVSGRVQRLALFGPPPLLEGEDAAIYDQLLARFCVAVKPVDIIDEMLIAG